ncbi:MAG: flavodoxin [Desulfovibrionaceae bacterium]|nr:flavodoxin [Desulfovibrionaceae bacterium]
MKHQSSSFGRRAFLLGLAGAAALLGSAGSGSTLSLAAEIARAATPSGTDPRRILIVFYSRSGNTRELAGELQSICGGRLAELQPQVPYSSDYNATVERFREERAGGVTPPIKPLGIDIRDYDAVLIGSPSWGGSVAPPVWTFLKENDLAGKRVAVFITHGGSGLGHAEEDVRARAPKAVLLEGFARAGRSVGTARSAAASWLKRIGLA